MEYITHNGDTFEVVDRMPLGYEIWNIGSHMVDGYLPLCRLSKDQPFDGARNIEPDTLKAIKCDGAQVILRAVSGGYKTVAEMEDCIRRHKNAKPGTCAHMDVERCKAALPYMRQFKH